MTGEPIVFAPLESEPTVGNVTGTGVANLRALRVSAREEAGDYGVVTLPALEVEGQHDTLTTPTVVEGIATLPMLTIDAAVSQKRVATGAVDLPALGAVGREIGGDYGYITLPPLRATGFDVYTPLTSYIHAWPRPAMSVLGSFVAGHTSSVAFTDEFDFEMLLALYSSVKFDDRLTVLMDMIMELEDNIQLRDAMQFIIEARIEDSAAFGDLATITPRALLAITSALVFTDDTDAHINALLAIASAFSLADRIRFGYDISLVSSAEFADLIATELDALMSLVSEALMTDDALGTLSMVMFASSDAMFGDEGGVTGLLAMLMSLEDGVQLSVRFRLPDGDSYAGYLVNTRNAAVSRLTHHNFNSMATIGNKLYAAGEEGIYVTGGDTFDGVPINAFVRTGLTDFGSSELKRMAESYVGYTSDGQLVLKVTTTDGGRKKENWYALRSRAADSPVEGRFEPARGLTARYWGFEIGNIDGADFQLDDLRVFPLTTIKRRKSGR